MDLSNRLEPFREPLFRLCEEYGVGELSVFGSILREDFGAGSDIDLLVEFLPGIRVGLFHLIRLQRALEELFGRTVDLVPKDGLRPQIRDHVLESAKRVYGAPPSRPEGQ